jgi:hypothetical protein
MNQGCSDVTPIKEIQIRGVIETRLNQRKLQPKYINRIGIFDIFCGDGTNIVDGESIPGSPLEIINAIQSTGVFKTKGIDFFASDNRQDAVDTLTNLLTREVYPFSVNIIKKPADEQLEFVHWYLSENRRHHVILLVDPNGPGVIPFDKLNHLSKFSSRLDVIINISESAILRIKACSKTKHKNWWAGYQTFEDILWELLRGYNEGWIRDVIKGDRQKWRIMTMWSWCPPRNAWEKQRLYRIKTKQNIIDILDGRCPNGVGNSSIGPLFACNA